jgi:hypothetical protein
LTDSEATEADSLDDHFAVSYKEDFRVDQLGQAFPAGVVYSWRG